jgi:hypothetical protein
MRTITPFVPFTPALAWRKSSPMKQQMIMKTQNTLGVWAAIAAALSAATAVLAGPPPISWQNAYGGKGLDEARSIASTGDGGFLIAGNSASPQGGTKTSGVIGSKDFWVVRIDGAGQQLWDRSFGGTSVEELTTVRRTLDGGFVLSGWSASGSDGNKSSQHFGRVDGWLVRIDANGNKLWDRSFGGDDLDTFEDVLALPDGGFLLCGLSSSRPSGVKQSPHYGGNDAWLVRVDANGGLVWERTFGGVNADWFRVIRAFGGNRFLFGGTSHSPTSPAKLASNWGGGDFWFVQVDLDGNRIAEGSFGGIKDEVLSDMIVLRDGGLLLTGQSLSPVGGLKSTPNFSAPDGSLSADAWVVRLDATWNKIWDRSFGGIGADNAKAVELLADGGFLLAGHTDAAGGGNKTAPRYGWEDYWLVRLEPDGSKVWEDSLGSSESDELAALLRTDDSGFILAGQSWEKTDQTKTAPSFGAYDYFVARIHSDLPRLRSVSQGPEEIKRDGFRLTLIGEPNRMYRTEYSMDFINWNLLQIDYLGGTEVEIQDRQAANQPARFYRVLPEPTDER